MKNHNTNPFILSSASPSHRGIIKRKWAERRFMVYGYSSIIVSILFLLFLFYTIFSQGFSAFLQTKILVEVKLGKYFVSEAGPMTVAEKKEVLKNLNYRIMVSESLKNTFPNAKSRMEIMQIYSLVSRNSYLKVKEIVEKRLRTEKSLKKTFIQNVRVWLPASTVIDMAYKGKIPEDSTKISTAQRGYIKRLQEEGKIAKFFNRGFFTLGDSREPESAGILGSVMGSIFTIIICMLTSLPLGLAAAIYLQEFAPKSRLKSIVELAINNLAAVPSIVFGLLGLALFITFFGLPRSSALVGGFTLAILVLPVIIVTSRNALASVPSTIRSAAIGLGASKMQVVFHHVLPLSLPGIMTGSILSVARALGETAPLLMIGMVAFIADIPSKLTDPATALPVQIYIWSDLPEMGFQEKTSAAIIILLLFLVTANSIAIYLRKKFEKKW
ncbi:MAG TPA: phosphate ABC transporter permease PtsA [Alphaproteobacteria bacterium]|nr:phosphate ABC transporter permease PtsA [Alphaproteobacteria bacterium]